MCFLNYRFVYMCKICKEFLFKDVGEIGVLKFVLFKIYCYKLLKLVKILRINVKGGDLDKFNKIFFMMFMMEIFGKILMVENMIF